MLEHAGVQITWLGHDGFRLKKDKVLHVRIKRLLRLIKKITVQVILRKPRLFHQARVKHWCWWRVTKLYG